MSSEFASREFVFSPDPASSFGFNFWPHQDPRHAMCIWFGLSERAGRFLIPGLQVTLGVGSTAKTFDEGSIDRI